MALLLTALWVLTHLCSAADVPVTLSGSTLPAGNFSERHVDTLDGRLTSFIINVRFHLFFPSFFVFSVFFLLRIFYEDHKVSDCQVPDFFSLSYLSFLPQHASNHHHHHWHFLWPFPFKFLVPRHLYNHCSCVSVCIDSLYQSPHTCVTQIMYTTTLPKLTAHIACSTNHCWLSPDTCEYNHPPYQALSSMLFQPASPPHPHGPAILTTPPDFSCIPYHFLQKPKLLESCMYQKNSRTVYRPDIRY